MLTHRLSQFMLRLLIVPLLSLTAWGCSATADTKSYRVYVGTYTPANGSRGIYAFEFDGKKGRAGEPVLAAEATNPSFLAVNRSRDVLYAVGEIGRFEGRSSGSVSAYKIDGKTGALLPLNTQPSGGGGPCHVAVHPSGRYVLVANYGGGSVSVLPVEVGGKLGAATAFVQHTGFSANPQRQAGPHAHWVGFSPDGTMALTSDLGLDKVLVYRLDAETGKLEPHSHPFGSVTPGSGPRHFAFHPSGKWAYVNNELTSSVTAFKWDNAQGTLQAIQTTSTLPAEVPGNSTAQIVAHPNGRFLYVSNRGHDSIAVFSIDTGTGLLTPTGHVTTGGKTPRNFNIDPAGRWLIAANQASDNVVIFRIDQETGMPVPTGQQLTIGMPVCIEFVELDD